MLILHPLPLLSLFHHSSLSDNFKYFIKTMRITENKKIKHANKSWAKHSPKTKYATLNTAKSKSDTFVLWNVHE